MSLAASAARMLARSADTTMVLAREGELTTITLKGRRIGGTTEAVGNSATEQRFRVKIGTAELLASAWATKVPSANTDTITVDGVPRTVVDVRPIKDGATTALYELEVAG